MFVYAVMEAHFHLSPLIEPIGRKPYLKKWIDHRSAPNGSKITNRQHQFNDIYRYLFQVLEQENLELAYKFRYTVEVAGSAPFIERQDQLDKALKRAKNKAFEPLENLLQQIQMDLGLDYDQPASTITIKRPIVREAIKLDPEYEDTILPYLPDLTTPDNTDHHIPFGQYNWQQPDEDLPGLPDDALVASDAALAPHQKLNQDKHNNLIDNPPEEINKSPVKETFFDQILDNQDSLTGLAEDNAAPEAPESPDIRIDAKVEETAMPDETSGIGPGVHPTHTPVVNKGALDQEALNVKPSGPGLSSPEAADIHPDNETSIKSGLSDNDKEKYQESLPEDSVQDMAADASQYTEGQEGYLPPPLKAEKETQIQEDGTDFDSVAGVEDGDHSDARAEKLVATGEVNIAVDKMVLPADDSVPNDRQPEDEKQLDPDATLKSPSTLSNESTQSSDLEEIAAAKVNVSHDFPELIGSGELNARSAEIKQESSQSILSESVQTGSPDEIHPDSQSGKSSQELISVSNQLTKQQLDDLPSQTQPIETVHDQNLDPGFLSAKNNQHSESDETVGNGEPKEKREITVAADKLVLPVDESSLPSQQPGADIQSTIDFTIETSSMSSTEASDLSAEDSIKTEAGGAGETVSEHSQSNDKVEQAANFFEQSDSLKSHGAANHDDDADEEFESVEDGEAKPSQHKSLTGKSSDKAPRSIDRSFMKALKSPIHHLKSKISLKDNSPVPLDEVGEEKTEHHPNLPKLKRKKLSLPFKIRKSATSTSEDEIMDQALESSDPRKGVDYNLRGFSLPVESDNQAENETDTESNASKEDTQEESRKEIKEYADPRIGLIQSRKELILRINKSRENGSNGESNNPNWVEKSAVANSPPPPLYNFKFTLRKPIIQSMPDTYDHGTALVIFKDCIERRSETHAEKKHFFAGSNTWNYFQRKDYRPFYRDTTSLVIQKDCIEHRIVHNPLPSKHTFQMSSSELETFKAFDSYYSESSQNEDDYFYQDDSDGYFDESDDYSYFDPYEEELKEQALFEKNRKELYQSCLTSLTQKEGLLFDYKAGKISIDKTDKHEVENWIRSQKSESIEMYRTYTEAIMHPEIATVKDVQNFVRSKLKKADFPNQRVVDIFDRLKQHSNSVNLRRQDLISILKRQDYVSVSSDSLLPTLSFSNSYSRYRAWRETVESPKIEVRPVSASERRPIIPFESFRKSWSYLDTPKINVRSSSDYQFKRTLPVFDKMINWKKSHS